MQVSTTCIFNPEAILRTALYIQSRPIHPFTEMDGNLTTYQAFSKDFASYQQVNAQAGPSKTTIHLDSQLPQDAVLDEEEGLVASLMGSLESVYV